jgi:hypothetical protein
VERETKIKYIKNRLDLTTRDATDMFEYLKSNWGSAKVSEMATHLKLLPTTVRSIARKIDLGPRPERASHLDPSRKEIRRLTAEIRKTWSPEEKARRDLRGRSEAGRGRPAVSIGIEAPSFSRTWL